MAMEGEERVKGLGGSGRRNWERAEGGYWGCLAARAAPSFRILEQAAQHRGDGEAHGCRTWGAGHGAGDPSQLLAVASARQGQTRAVLLSVGTRTQTHRAWLC